MLLKSPSSAEYMFENGNGKNKEVMKKENMEEKNYGKNNGSSDMRTDEVMGSPNWTKTAGFSRTHNEFYGRISAGDQHRQ